MTANKVAGVLSTKVKMDTVEAQKSLRQLNNDISSTVSILKQQEQEFKSSGDSVGALQTKISRLTETQNGYYEKLKLLKQAQNDVKARLGESSVEYQKYQTQINKTVTTISRYDDQIQKAEKSLQYYDSGLGKLRQSLSEQQRLSQSLVERLKAEGNAWKANEVELKQNRATMANLKEQYEIQDDELAKIKNKLTTVSSEYSNARIKLNELAQSQGKSSNAYKEQLETLGKLKITVSNVNSELMQQQTRLNKTATEIANTKSKASLLNEEFSKSHPNFLQKVRKHLTTADEKTNKLSLSTAKLFAANMLSNGLTSALSALSAKFSDLISQGNEYLDYEEKMNATWLTLTGNARKGEDMVNTINQLATASQNSTQMVDGLAKQFYAVTQNKSKTEELSKSVLTLQDAFGASDDAVQNFAQQYSQMVANGKASAQDFLSFTNVFPQLKQQLLDYEKSITHNSKMTTKDLNDMISNGKISAETMNTVLVKMADQYQDATENFTNTIPGLKRTVDATMPQLIGAIEKPFYNMKNPVLGSLSKAITDPAVKNEVSKLGKTLTDALDDVLNAFGGKKFDGVSVLKGTLESIEGAVKTFANTVVTHKKDIKEFMSAISTTSVATWKVFAETLQILLPVIKNVASVAAEHPKVFAAFASSMLVASSAAKVLRSPLLLLVSGIKGVTSAFKATKEKADIFTGAFKKIKSFVSPVTEVIKTLAGTLKNKLVEGVVKCVSHLKNFLGVFKTIGSFMLTNPLGIAITAISAIAVALVELYKHSSKFREFVDGLVKAAKEMAEKIGKWIGNMVQGVKEKFDAFKKACGKVGDKFNDMKESIKKGADNLKDKVGKKFNELKDGISDWASKTKKKIDGWADNINDAGKRAKNKMADAWDKMKKSTSDAVSAITDKNSKLHDKMINKISDATGVSKDTMKNAYNTMNDYTKTWKDLLSGKWDRLGGDLKSTAKDLSKTAKSTFSDMYDKLNERTHGGLDKIKKKWSNLWGDLKDKAKSGAKNVGNGAVSMVNNVIKSINSMIKGVQKGINWVLDKFGADKVKFGTIETVPKFAKGGTVGTGGTMALVNDAPGNNYREMFATPDGQIGVFPKTRNFMTYLPEGTQILDGERSNNLAKAMNIPAFKDGTDNTNLFAKMFDKAWDMAKNVANVIAHPIKFLENTFTKYVQKGSDTIGRFATDIVGKAPSYFAKQGGNWLKKLAENWKKKQDSVSAKNIGAGVKNWTDTIKQVAKEMKVDLSESNLNLLLKLIQTESGGDQSVTQKISDVNSANGDPAKGLLQYTTATFKRYMQSGHTNILSGVDQLHAFFNNSNWAADLAAWSKRMAAGITGWGPSGSKRFANGGFVNAATNAIIGEAGAEVVIPLTRQNRALDLLTQTINRMNQRAGRKTIIQSQNGSTLENKVDRLIDLVSQLIAVNSNGFAKQSNGVNIDGVYEKMYQDQILNNYQSF